MRTMTKTLITLAGLLCAGVLLHPLMAGATDAQVEAAATVVVFRHADDAGQPYAIWDNGTQVGSLLPGQRLVLRLNPGTHALLADADAPQRFFLEAKAGDLRFIEAAARDGDALLGLSDTQSFVAFAPGP